MNTINSHELGKWLLSEPAMEITPDIAAKYIGPSWLYDGSRILVDYTPEHHHRWVYGSRLKKIALLSIIYITPLIVLSYRSFNLDVEDSVILDACGVEPILGYESSINGEPAIFKLEEN